MPASAYCDALSSATALPAQTATDITACPVTSVIEPCPDREQICVDACETAYPIREAKNLNELLTC